MQGVNQKAEIWVQGLQSLIQWNIAFGLVILFVQEPIWNINYGKIEMCEKFSNHTIWIEDSGLAYLEACLPTVIQKLTDKKSFWLFVSVLIETNVSFKHCVEVSTNNQRVNL